MPSRYPYVGQLVLYSTGDGGEVHGGQAEHAALVTRVHSATVVNLRVFWDMQRASGMRDQAQMAANRRGAGWRYITGVPNGRLTPERSLAE